MIMPSGGHCVVEAEATRISLIHNHTVSPSLFMHIWCVQLSFPLSNHGVLDLSCRNLENDELEQADTPRVARSAHSRGHCTRSLHCGGELD